MTDVATWMAVLRGLHLAATLSLLGTAGFIIWMLPAALVVPDRLHRRLRRWWWNSGLVALLAGAAWFVLQAAAIAGAATLPEVVSALPPVAGHTRFGTILMVRLGLLLVATLLAVPLSGRHGGTGSKSVCSSGRFTSEVGSTSDDRALAWSCLVLCAAALGLQSLIGHAGAMAGATGDGVIVSEALHLVAAGIWLGGLVPLWLGLRTLAAAPAAAVCERFSPIGLACVLVLAATGLAQGIQLIGSVPAFFGTAYGHVALVKVGLFAFTLVLAALNRLWLTDRLAASASNARDRLLLSIGLETCAGLAIVTAAAFMASSVPAVHATPVWPWSWRFSLVTVNEDAVLFRDVVISLVMIGGAGLLVVAAMLGRRLRLAALGVLALALWLRDPSLRVLMVAAYPTSFQTSPSGFSAASIVLGQALFGPNCAGCHGAGGVGDGLAAAGLRIKPANLTTPHVWEHSDGEMFWWLSYGIVDPEGGLAMPGFGGRLAADDIWALIDYVRAHAAGSALQQEGAFDVPARAPALALACTGLAASRMDDLLGHVVHVVTKPMDQILEPAGQSIVTLVLRGDTSAGSCVAVDPAGWQAYAVLAELPPEKMEGVEFLIDSDGWLRAVHRPGTSGRWRADDLAAAIHAIRADPIQISNGNQHDHHH